VETRRFRANVRRSRAIARGSGGEPLIRDQADDTTYLGGVFARVGRRSSSTPHNGAGNISGRRGRKLIVLLATTLLKIEILLAFTMLAPSLIGISLAAAT